MTATYLLARGGEVEVFPYPLTLLKRDNPRVSFPQSPTDALLAEWSVFPVLDTPPPAYDQATESCWQGDPILENGSWKASWVVAPLSPSEVEERSRLKEQEVRSQRNALLTNCDWTQLPDAPVDAAPWATYRQALRDVPSQVGFPWDVVWPEAPAA